VVTAKVVVVLCTKALTHSSSDNIPSLFMSIPLKAL
jgi:TctA family transporter